MSALLTVLVGPPGSGKSTLAKDLIQNDGDHGAATVYVNQDSQGKSGHQEIFAKAIAERQHIIVDRMGFSRDQRNRYLDVARKAGYRTKIVVLHQPYQVCLERIRNRFGKHETIHDEKGARAALGTFFGQYQRPLEGEADEIKFVYPDGPKEKVIICDLDGTLCDVEHRRHHVRDMRTPDQLTGVEISGDTGTRMPPFKKNWPAFFRDIPKDPINTWCKDIIENFAKAGISTVFCSGRGSNEEKATREWLTKHDLGHLPLYMRDRTDSRQDATVKEMILDFELLTRYVPYFMIDDRDQVVKMWRRRGFTCLQCAEGNF